jgi:hypothetical protein
VNATTSSAQNSAKSLGAEVGFSELNQVLRHLRYRQQESQPQSTAEPGVHPELALRELDRQYIRDLIKPLVRERLQRGEVVRASTFGLRELDDMSVGDIGLVIRDIRQDIRREARQGGGSEMRAVDQSEVHKNAPTDGRTPDVNVGIPPNLGSGSSPGMPPYVDVTLELNRILGQTADLPEQRLDTATPPFRPTDRLEGTLEASATTAQGSSSPRMETAKEAAAQTVKANPGLLARMDQAFEHAPKPNATTTTISALGLGTAAYALSRTQFGRLILLFFNGLDNARTGIPPTVSGAATPG